MMCFARFTFLLTLLATAGAFIFVRVDNLQIVISGSNSDCRVQRSYTCLGWTLLRILEIFRVVDNILPKNQNHLRILLTRGSGRICQYSLVHPLDIRKYFRSRRHSKQDFLRRETFIATEGDATINLDERYRNKKTFKNQIATKTLYLGQEAHSSPPTQHRTSYDNSSRTILDGQFAMIT